MIKIFRRILSFYGVAYTQLEEGENGNLILTCSSYNAILVGSGMALDFLGDGICDVLDFNKEYHSKLKLVL